MGNRRKNDIRNLDIQTIVSIIFIGTTIISIILLLNERSYLKTGRYPINKNRAHDISLFSRILDAILIIILLYINYDNRRNAKQDTDLKNHDLQIVASAFNVVAALIVVYVILNSAELTSLSDVENPIV